LYPGSSPSRTTTPRKAEVKARKIVVGGERKQIKA